jgi:hypothetical protein
MAYKRVVSRHVTPQPAEPSGRQVIHLHRGAPAKPRLGQPCNGCGVCCASEPCPIGVLVTRRRHGRCAALEWHADAGLYRCGIVTRPAAYLPRALRWTAPAMTRVALRVIASGSGCDCSLVVEDPSPIDTGADVSGR